MRVSGGSAASAMLFSRSQIQEDLSMYARIPYALAIVSAAVGVVTSAQAAGDSDQRGWSLSIIGASSGGQSGQLLSTSQNAVQDLSVLDPVLTGPGTLSVDGLHYSDMFRPSSAAGIEAGYGLNNHVSITTRLSVARSLGRSLNLGVVSGSGIETPETLAAKFSDTDDVTVNVGARYAWTLGQRWRPFIGGGLGITRPDAIRASLASTSPSFALSDVEFTDRRHVLEANFIGGADLAIGPTFDLRFSAGADYTGATKASTDPALAALGLTLDRAYGGRLEYPIGIAAVFKLH